MQAYISYNKEDEKKVVENFERINKMKKFELIRLETDSFRVKIKESEFVVFFLSEEYLKTNRFKREFKYAKSVDKLTLLVFLGKFDLNILNIQLPNKSDYTLDFCDIVIDESSEPECYSRLEAFILRAFKLKVKNVTLDLELFSYKTVKTNYIDYISKPNVEFISTNELAVRKADGIFKIINFEDEKIICEVNTEMLSGYIFCIIDHTEQLLFSGTNRVSLSRKINLYSKNGVFQRTIEPDFKVSHIYSFGYSKTSKTVFAIVSEKDYRYSSGPRDIIKFTENFQCAEMMPIKGYKERVHDNYVYTVEATKLLVYDLNFKLLTSIDVIDNIDILIIDPKQNDIVILKSYRNIRILNTKNLEIICSYKYELEYGAIFNKMFIFGHNTSDNLKTYTFHKISFNESSIQIADEQYTCTMNQFKTHLLLNPYLLPCGHSVCLECIYENYNIYNKILKCNSCHQEYKLPQRLEKNEKITENLNELGQELIKIGNKLTIKRGKECF
jgi:hypothetical protein